MSVNFIAAMNIAIISLLHSVHGVVRFCVFQNTEPYNTVHIVDHEYENIGVIRLPCYHPRPRSGTRILQRYSVTFSHPVSKIMEHSVAIFDKITHDDPEVASCSGSIVARKGEKLRSQACAFLSVHNFLFVDIH